MRTGWYVGLAMAAAAPALAGQTADDEAASTTFDALAACRAVTNDAARLTCFDRAAEAFVAARTKGDVVVIDREKVVGRKRERFGLAASTREMFGGGREDEATEVREVETTISSIAAARGGQYVLALGNNSVWQTLDAPRFPPKVGQPIKLSTASLGGFRAAIAGRNSLAVKRLR